MTPASESCALPSGAPMLVDNVPVGIYVHLLESPGTRPWLNLPANRLLSEGAFTSFGTSLFCDLVFLVYKPKI